MIHSCQCHVKSKLGMLRPLSRAQVRRQLCTNDSGVWGPKGTYKKPMCEIVFQCFPGRKALLPTLQGGASIGCHYFPTSDVWLPRLSYYFGATHNGREREGTDSSCQGADETTTLEGAVLEKKPWPPWQPFYSSNTGYAQCHQPPAKDAEHCRTAATKLPAYIYTLADQGLVNLLVVL